MASSGKVGTHTGHCSARQTEVRDFLEHTQGGGEMLYPGSAGESKCRVGFGRAQGERMAIRGRHLGQREQQQQKCGAETVN